ncbi:TniB family NTP-binding protein [Paraburkholderia aspalathi]|uniref:TniB family NTP-binding protein n=1 Tax=Paraburkholderia aspalathi TaxID=1324617 RepID=UPI0038B9D2E3
MSELIEKPVAAAIIRSLRRSFTRFPHVKRAISALDRLYAYDCIDEEPEHMMLIGESGVGKSTLLIRFRDLHPLVEHEEFTEIPVLYIKVTPSCTPRKLAGLLARALGSPFWNKGKEEELTDQVKCLLKACKVKLVILDEANHLVDRGGEKTQHNTADWIKTLSDDVHISFVLAGIPRIEKLNHTNDQLRGRFREVIRVHRFSIANESAELEFRSVLAAFRKLLSDIPTVDFSEQGLAQKFAFATDGRLREIRKLLVRAVELAFEQEQPEITTAVLEDAFRQVIYPEAPNHRNPFHRSFKLLPLTASREPFERVDR